MRSITVAYRYIAFFDLLADAIFQHKMAMEAGSAYISSRYARASICASSLSIECFANCLLEISDAPKMLKEEFDRLSPLPKLEIALHLQGLGEQLDRGRSEVQRISELVKARNEFVHSKLTVLDASIDGLKDIGSELEVSISMAGEQWKMLGIPKVAMFWSKRDSLSVLLAISLFYRHVLIDLVKVSEDQLIEALTSRVEIGDIAMLGVYDEFRKQIVAASEFGVDFSFLGVPTNT